MNVLVTKSKQEAHSAQPTVISLFTCGMGMDLGFEKAGFNTVYANDITKFACNTIRENRPKLPCDERDITEIPSKKILERAGFEKGEIDSIFLINTNMITGIKKNPNIIISRMFSPVVMVLDSTIIIGYIISPNDTICVMPSDVSVYDDIFCCSNTWYSLVFSAR